MMEGIDLEIFLDKPEKIYPYGDKIKGEVKVTIHEEWQCDGLELFLGTKGFAEVTEGPRKFKSIFTDDKEKRLLYQGQWIPGRYSYPFEMEAPSGPFTYKGQMIDLSWYLKAVARTTRGKSVQAEAELVVVPGKGSRGKATQEKHPVIYTESPKGSLGCLVFSLVFFSAGIAAAVKTFQSENDTYLGFALFLALVGLLMILGNVYFLLVSKRIGMAEARIDSGIVSSGEIVPCSLSFQVNSPAEINGVGITLTCREEAGNVGIRASKKTFQKVIYEKRHDLQLPVKKIPANVPIQTEGEISVPPDAAPSFTVANNLGDGIRVRWNVEFRIEMKRWPDWVHREELTVRPQTAS
ncbi:MAG: hypothetical protein JXD19_08845 [Deltaproteobacteria bacterium]|nr:hypothetical protein [Deltaproteobacteria bacterium]